jgi:cobalt-zinc-cadmium efflux system membrane fusion protein
MNPNLSLYLLPAVLALLALLSTACAGRQTTSAEASARRAPGNPLEITLDANLQKFVRVGVAQTEPVSSTLRVAGRIEADGTRLARISAPVTGRILDMKVIEGQQVHAGEVLATIYTTELSSAQSELLKLLAQRQVAERAVARARQLLEAGVIGTAELQRREAELQQAIVDLSAARERLRILGMNDETIAALEKTRTLSSVIPIVSTIDGTVLERTATPGQIVQAAEPVFVVTDLSHVWLVADVPEQSAGRLRVGQPVEAEIPALAGHKVHGRISFVSATVNRETRTVSIRMNLPNPQRIYKPAMLATLTIVEEPRPQLVVPAAAVVRDGNTDSVFVQTAPQTFLLRPVKAGEEIGGKRVILEGLKPGERIVVEGAFHLNNERRRRTMTTEA